MFRLLAPPVKGKKFTGSYMSVPFKKGMARVKKDYLRKMLMRFGCKDITTPEEEEAMWNREMKRVLFIRWGALGDNLIITPAIRAFKLKHPDAELFVSGKFPQDQVWLNNPYINGIVSVRPADIGHLAGEYDEVIDFTHSIEHNALADWKNASEIACDWVRAHPEDGDYRPVYSVSEKEKVSAASILAEHGIDVDQDRIAILHPESTCALRTYPGRDAGQIAKLLVDAGYKVVFPTFKNYYTILPKDIARPRDVICLNQEVESDTIAPRFVFATAHFADVIIAVDSFYSHLAAALDKPSVIIYGSFEPALRAKHYPKAHVVYRPMPCGPCQQVLSYCARFPSIIPPCMTQYSPEEIVEKAMEAVDGPREEPLPELQLDISVIRRCPGCNAGKVTAVTRKGPFFYLKCDRCGTIYTDKEENPENQQQSEEEYAPTDAHVAQYAQVLKQVSKYHLPDMKDIILSSVNNIPERISPRLSGWNLLVPPGGEDIMAIEGENQTDMVAFWFSLERIAVPGWPLKRASELVRPGGVIVIYGAVSNTYHGRNNWLPINLPVCGTNKTLLSKAAIEHFAKNLGLEVLKFDIIGDYALTVLRKMSQCQDT